MDSTTNNNSQAPLWPFDALPEEIKSWLRSEAVEGIVQELNKKFGFANPPQERAIGYASTWLVLGYIKPEEFVQTLAQDFGIDQKMSQSVATVVKERIFRPIRMGMKNHLYIDIARIDELPKTPIKPAQKTQMAAPLAPPSAQNTVNLRAQGPQAKTTEMQKGFVPPKQPAPIKPAPAKPEKPTGPQAKENDPEHPFSLTEQNPNPSGSPNNE